VCADARPVAPGTAPASTDTPQARAYIEACLAVVRAARSGMPTHDADERYAKARDEYLRSLGIEVAS